MFLLGLKIPGLLWCSINVVVKMLHHLFGWVSPEVCAWDIPVIWRRTADDSSPHISVLTTGPTDCFHRKAKTYQTLAWMNQYHLAQKITTVWWWIFILIRRKFLCGDMIKMNDNELPLQRASAAELRFAAAAAWPSPAALTASAPHADSPPTETQTHKNCPEEP